MGTAFSNCLQHFLRILLSRTMLMMLVFIGRPSRQMDQEWID